MARELNRLSALGAKNAGPGMHGDGGGLWLVKQGQTSGKWILRVHVHGRRREMGLGPYPQVALKDARAEAEVWRRVVWNGKDPIKVREAQRRAAERNLHLLDDVAEDAFNSLKAGLKGDGKAGRWKSPLDLHILPKLGRLPVADLDQIDIRDTLKPIWKTKPDTAKKALQRLNMVIRHAAALGLMVDLQATDKAKLLLGDQNRQVKNIPALPWAETPAFYQGLSADTVTQLALRLLILTAVRSSPLRHIKLEQIDTSEALWTVPSEMMKGKRGQTQDFRVPLSPEALAVIEAARPLSKNGYLFPSVRKGVISDATMGAYMKRAKMDARPHGFRSSFRTWAAERTDAPRDVAEECLAHSVAGKVERSYRRTDLLEQRRALMDRWSLFVSGKQSADVLPMEARR